jgi:predicted dehydrogenase
MLRGGGGGGRQQFAHFYATCSCSVYLTSPSTTPSAALVPCPPFACTPPTLYNTAASQRSSSSPPSSSLHPYASVPGDLAIIFTPDDSHFDIATACIHHGLHVCVTKPLVQTLQQHRALAELALERRVLSYVEVHKRWDPMYIDAAE